MLRDDLIAARATRRPRRQVVDLAYLFERTIPEPNTGCWLWLGGINADGYGTIRIHGASHRAHRLALGLHRGAPLLATEVACHRCDQPSCINPSHLFAGSQGDNIRDAVAKGRHATGEAHIRAKLTRAAVRFIRESTAGSTDLARRLGVSRELVRDVRAGKVWRSLQ